MHKTQQYYMLEQALMKRLINILDTNPVLGAILAALIIIPTVSIVSYAAVTQISGLAVAGPGNAWINVKDAGQFADPQTRGILSMNTWLFTGTNFVKQRGSAAGAASVQLDPSGNAFFAVKRDNITTSSVNLAFGFTSKKVSIEFPFTNTDEICIDWVGGTAVCPSANSSGDDRFSPGDTIILDEYAVTSLSIIAASGTQTVYIRAWE